MNKKEKHNLRKKQAASMLFLGFALCFMIIGQTVEIGKMDFSSAQTSLIQSQNRETTNKPMKIKAAYLSTYSNNQEEIIRPENIFTPKDKNIALSVKLENPKNEELVTAQFFYFNEKNEAMEIRKEAKKASKEQSILTFHLINSGNTWQLQGSFKAIITTSTETLEVPFSIGDLEE